MSVIEIKIPAMGEGVIEATIIKWHVKEGEYIKTDDVLCDIATDKVDSEITSPENGRIESILFKENEIVPVGTTILKLINDKKDDLTIKSNVVNEVVLETVAIPEEKIKENKVFNVNDKVEEFHFLSPLVKSMINEHKLSSDEIKLIQGSGFGGRITKDDVQNYLNQKGIMKEFKPEPRISEKEEKLQINSSDTVIEMDRVRKLIADHMIRSKQTSAHVTSFIEADVTSLVDWRNKNKDSFKARYGINLTFLPFFIDSTIKAIKEFSVLNSSVSDNKIIIHKSINIGIATALPNNNLIVPVIKNTEQLNVIGIIKLMNDLADRARSNQLKPDEIIGGTFSITNLGTFGTLAGTPIINQPQVAILGIGAIRKMPAVIETEFGDVIAVRQKVILSLAYDHRVIDGMLAGKFLKKLVELIESFKPENF